MKQLKHALGQKHRLSEKKALIQRHRQEIINLNYERNQEPGPGHYQVPMRFGNARHGFKMADGNPKTELDWQILKASKEPGAGAYTPFIPGGVHDAKVARFGKGKTPSDLEHQILHANDTPSPGLYQQLDFKCTTPSAKWGKNNPLTELDLAVKHGASMPGPGDYYSYEPSMQSIKELRSTLHAHAQEAEAFNKKLQGTATDSGD